MCPLVGVTFSSGSGSTVNYLLTIVFYFSIKGSAMQIVLRVLNSIDRRSFTSILSNINRFCVFNSCKCILVCFMVNNLVNTSMDHTRERYLSEFELRPAITLLTILLYCVIAFTVRECRRTMRKTGLAISCNC